MTKLSELKRICDDATQGEWVVSEIRDADSGNIMIEGISVHQEIDGPLICDMSDEEDWRKNSKYIATFSPSRVKKMIELLEIAAIEFTTNAECYCDGDALCDKCFFITEFEREFENENNK